MIDDLYTIKYYMDEVRVHPSKCLNPSNCTCDKTTADTSEAGVEIRCNMSAADARKHLIAYYRDRANYLEKMSLEDFLHDQGIYS